MYTIRYLYTKISKLLYFIYTSASFNTSSTVSSAGLYIAVLVRVDMILGRMMSHKVVSAAQNRSKKRSFLYFIRYGENRFSRVTVLYCFSAVVLI